MKVKIIGDTNFGNAYTCLLIKAENPDRSVGLAKLPTSFPNTIIIKGSVYITMSIIQLLDMKYIQYQFLSGQP